MNVKISAGIVGLFLIGLGPSSRLPCSATPSTLISTGSPKTSTRRARPRRRWPTCGGQRLCHCSRLVSVDHDAVDVDGRVRYVIAASVNEVGCSSCGVEESANHTPADLLIAAPPTARCRNCRRGSFILNLPHIIRSARRLGRAASAVLRGQATSLFAG